MYVYALDACTKTLFPKKKFIELIVELLSSEALIAFYAGIDVCCISLMYFCRMHITHLEKKKTQSTNKEKKNIFFFGNCKY